MEMIASTNILEATMSLIEVMREFSKLVFNAYMQRYMLDKNGSKLVVDMAWILAFLSAR